MTTTPPTMVADLTDAIEAQADCFDEQFDSEFDWSEINDPALEEKINGDLLDVREMIDSDAAFCEE